MELDDDRNAGGNIVLLGAVVLMCLFLLKNYLHTLRQKNYVGLASILALCHDMVK